jgi:2,4-diaminopentanoate dehydrogenase
MDADLVIMTPKLSEDDDLIALLRSGKDVITPLSYFAPGVEGAELMAGIERTCHEGGSMLHGARIGPASVCDRVPAVLTALALRSSASTRLRSSTAPSIGLPT